MSIGQRLLLLVAVTLLGLVGSGVYGVIQLKGLQSNFEEVNDRSVPSLIAMGRVNDQFNEARTLLLALLMEDDSDLRKAFIEKIRASEGALKNATDAFQKIPGAEEAATQMKPMAETYNQAIETVIANSEEKDQAQLMLYTKVVPAEKAFSIFLEKSHTHLLDNQKRLKDQVEVRSSRAVSIFPSIIALTTVIVAVLGVMLHRSVMFSLKEMTAAMRNVATKLDFRQRVTVHSNDEVGVAVVAFNSLLETVQTSLKEVASSMAVLSDSTNRLTKTSHEIQSISEQTSESSSAIAVTVQEVTSNIHHIVTQAEQAEILARDSGHQAIAGGEVIQGTINQIQSIASTVDAAAIGINELRSQIVSISTVVSVIREVADQTNLLALNAAIEAARAGEQGRGFAVVADEVRKLAERTATSTQEISKLIQSIQQSAVAAVNNMEAVVERVENGVSSANTAITALQGIRGSSDKVLETVSAIALAIRGQGTATTQIAQQFQRIANISEEARNAVAETSQNTQDLEGLANRVNDAVKRYQI